MTTSWHRAAFGMFYLVLDGMLETLAREADLEWLMIDSIIVRAHQHAAGARKVKRGRMPRAWVGLAAARASGSMLPPRRSDSPVRLIASPGQRNDIAFAHSGSRPGRTALLLVLSKVWQKLSRSCDAAIVRSLVQGTS